MDQKTVQLEILNFPSLLHRVMHDDPIGFGVTLQGNTWRLKEEMDLSLIPCMQNSMHWEGSKYIELQKVSREGCYIRFG
jgi:hypothetical protein